MNIQKHGNSPYKTVVVHGGPGAPGEVRPVAIELSSSYGVLEPFQTADTINGQVEELKSVIENDGTPPVTLIGWSWGAWLSFITTAENPFLVKKLILISCGPFKPEYAKEIMPRRLSRLSSQDRLRTEELYKLIRKKEKAEDNKLLAEFGALMSKADSYNPLPLEKDDGVEVQMEIYQRIWCEAEELRRSGKLLEYGKKINCSVTVIHGEYDPAPYEGIRKPLSEVLKNCKFILLEKCGHHPWYEKEARKRFFGVLFKELK